MFNLLQMVVRSTFSILLIGFWDEFDLNRIYNRTDSVMHVQPQQLIYSSTGCESLTSGVSVSGSLHSASPGGQKVNALILHFWLINVKKKTTLFITLFILNQIKDLLLSMSILVCLPNTELSVYRNETKIHISLVLKIKGRKLNLNQINFSYPRV